MKKRKEQKKPLGALSGDGVSEGDELALGLYKAMMVLRMKTDIPEKDFQKYRTFRDETLEEADEVWRVDDSEFIGSCYDIFYFLKEYTSSDLDDPFYYIVATAEDPSSNSHSILFSFPTKDHKLTERYQRGELFESEGFTQEESH